MRAVWMMLSTALLGTALLCGPARAADPLTWTERLAALNPVPGPINLRGDRGEFELYFNLSTRIEPTSAGLHLEMTNSQSLLAPRSQLVIRLNDVAVAQLALKPDAPVTVADIALPVELLRGGGNRLSFTAAQHYTLECESPDAAELWSQIDTSRSRLSVIGRVIETAPVLSELQDLIGPGLFGGHRYTLMAPVPDDGPSDTTIAVGATLSEAVALRLRYQAAAINFVPARNDGSSAPTLRLAAPPTAQGNGPSDILLFGTAAELRPMLGPKVAGAITSGFLGVYPLPSDPRRLVLVVSGTTADEVARAAAAFGIANFPFVDAPQQTIEALEVHAGEPFFPYNVLKEGTKTSFAELGLRTTTLRGTTGQVGVDFILPPDFYLPDSAQAELSLDYAYGSGTRAGSVMNVLVNGQFQQAIALSDAGGAVLRGYRVQLPARKLRPGRNRVDFELVMSPIYAGACAPPETRNLIMSLAESSTITLPKWILMAAQPDLRLFAATGYPYVGSPGFDMALASRDPLTVAAGWTLAARLAQVAGRTLPEGRMVVGPPMAGRHTIAIGAAAALAPAVVAAGPVGVQNGGALPYETAGPLPLPTPSLQQSLREWAGLTSPVEAQDAPAASWVRGIGALGRNGLLMAARAPGGGVFTLTTLTAQSREALAAATQSLVGPFVWPKLEDNVSLWRPAAALKPATLLDASMPDAVFTERIGGTYHLGSFGTLYAARYFIAEYPLVWLGVIAAMVLLMVAMLRVSLVARRRRVHPGSTEGIP